MDAPTNLPDLPWDESNWLIHLLYTRGDFDDCLEEIEEQLVASKGMCEYAIFVKGLIKRQQGKVQQALELFQAATCLNPTNTANLKQMARSLYLLGKHHNAIDVYNEVLQLAEDQDDWEVFHFKGLCYAYLQQYDEAVDAFEAANSIQRHDSTFIQLGKVLTLKDDLEGALDVYMEALEFSPHNPELLTTIGLLHLRTGDNFKAFDFLGNSLTYDPRNPRTILAAGSIIQDHNDMDVALVKYRVAATQVPDSPQLWNNIGICFFGKQKYVAASACLKRALYQSPFDWIICYNLGLVHLSTGQYTSAFHYFSASINLKSTYASTYMYLAITLSRLGDFENACAAYEKAISLEDDHLFRLNYAITLYNANETSKSRSQFLLFKKSPRKLAPLTGASAHSC